MYFPNTIEEVCYDENHIDTVEKALKEGFDKYFQRYIETENGNAIVKCNPKMYQSAGEKCTTTPQF